MLRGRNPASMQNGIEDLVLRFNVRKPRNGSLATAQARQSTPIEPAAADLRWESKQPFMNSRSPNNDSGSKHPGLQRWVV